MDSVDEQSAWSDVSKREQKNEQNKAVINRVFAVFLQYLHGERKCLQSTVMGKPQTLSGKLAW